MPDLSDSVNWSEVDANNNQSPPNGWPEGQMPSTVNDCARADRGALKRFWDKINPVQIISAVGGVYTFTTGNSAYPTSYIEGEVYSFRPGSASLGNDQFQVNALPPKPIWKRTIPGSTGLVPIAAHDITVYVPASLTYVAALAAGAGAFLLDDPFVPVFGDGSGTGVNVPGVLTVNARLQVQSSWTNQPSAPPMINICDTDLPPATSGWWRIGVGSAGAFRLERNTAGAGDFSSTQGVILVDPSTYLTSFTTGGIQVAGPSEFQAPVTFDGAASVTLNGSVTLPVTATLTVGGETWLNGGLNLAGAIAEGGQTLLVHGTTQVNGDLSATGALNVGGAINVTGPVLATVGVTAQGFTSGSNGITSNGPLVASGPTNLNGGLDIHGAIPGGGQALLVFGVSQINGDNNVSGNSTINGNLTVGGTLNGHPAMVLDTLIARITALEEQVRVLQG